MYCLNIANGSKSNRIILWQLFSCMKNASSSMAMTKPSFSRREIQAILPARFRQLPGGFQWELLIREPLCSPLGRKLFEGTYFCMIFLTFVLCILFRSPCVSVAVQRTVLNRSTLPNAVHRFRRNFGCHRSGKIQTFKASVLSVPKLRTHLGHRRRLVAASSMLILRKCTMCTKHVNPGSFSFRYASSSFSRVQISDL